MKRINKLLCGQYSIAIARTIMKGVKSQESARDFTISGKVYIYIYLILQQLYKNRLHMDTARKKHANMKIVV